jgi:hypothetical protein
MFDLWSAQSKNVLNIVSATKQEVATKGQRLDGVTDQCGAVGACDQVQGRSGAWRSTPGFLPLVTGFQAGAAGRQQIPQSDAYFLMNSYFLLV